MDAIYEQLFGKEDEEEAAVKRTSASKKPPPSGGSISARGQRRILAMRDSVLRVERLRIIKVLYPTNLRPCTADDQDSEWIVFVGTAPATGERKWKGRIPRPDMLHEYSAVYKLEQDSYYPTQQVAVVLKVLETKRAPLTEELLMTIMCDSLRMSAAVARRTIERLSPEARSGTDLGAFLRQAGNSTWLRNAESRLCYFRDWYIEALTPPYDSDALRYLRSEAVDRIARIAVAEPWRLCFWWMTGAALLEEITAAQAAALAKKFGGAFPEKARLATEAYTRRPFGDARSRGDSYVDHTNFDSEKVPMGTLAACLEIGVATVVGERVYCVGDLECEKEIATLITRAITTPEGADYVRMRPRCSWWPEGDATAPLPTNEQADAIDAVTRTRLGIVCGKPGTGKTAIVMRALCSAFLHGQCVGVSFTGMAADHQHKVTRYGVTIHKVVNEWRSAGSDPAGLRPHKFSGRSVLVVEETSSVSMRLLHALLVALGPSLRRVYFFGDYRQMPPPDGGPSILTALVRRYAGTPVVSELCASMRVTDASGAFVRNLDRICEHRVHDGLEWSPHPSTGHPFVFLERGRTAQEHVAVIRAALEAAGIDPDAGRAQIMVRRNDTRVEVARAWYEACPLGRQALVRGMAFEEHEFSVGERIMFLRNANRTYRPTGSKLTASRVMNGTIGTIAEIFDEDPCNADAPCVQVVDTRVRKRHPGHRRWLRVAPDDLLVLLDSYGKQRITRVPPVTIDKMQGLETDYSIVLLVKPVTKLGSKGMYSACSRGKLGCFVVADMDPANAPASGRCPSRDFAETVMASKDVRPRTDFWARFPPYADVQDVLAVDPGACVYYTAKSADGKQSETESDDDTARLRRRAAPPCHMYGVPASKKRVGM